MGEPSLFDLILNGTVPSHKVAEGEDWYAFLDIFPRREGHTLVIPKQSVQRMLELTPQSRDALFDGVVQVQSVLSNISTLKISRFVFMTYPLAGQEIPHVHVHILPRHSGDGGGTLHSMWPQAEPHGGDVDHGQLAELSRRLQGVEQ